MPRRSQPRSPERRPRRRYHFGSPAVVYIFVTLLLALGAFNSQNNLLFWAFGFSLATLMVSGFVSGAMLMGIDVRRDRIDDAVAGEPLWIRYRVRNRNRLIPSFALTIEELPALRDPADGPESVHAALPHPTTSRIDQPRAFVAHIGAREQITAACSVRARSRGRVAFRGFVVHTSFPFGLVRKSLYFAQPAGAVILPAPVEVDSKPLEQAISAGDAERPGRARGTGDEFHSLRDYSPGDSPRSIAWKASARRGVLLVRQTLAPAPARAWIVLRLTGARDETVDERAIGMAATLIRRTEELGLSVGLAVPHARIQSPPRIVPGAGGTANPTPHSAGAGPLGAQSARLMRELGLIELADLHAASREPVAFPRLSLSNAREIVICVHAGPIDPAFSPGGGAGGATVRGPQRVIHWSALTDTPIRVESGAAGPAHGAGSRTGRSREFSGVPA